MAFSVFLDLLIQVWSWSVSLHSRIIISRSHSRSTWDTAVCYCGQLSRSLPLPTTHHTSRHTTLIMDDMTSMDKNRVHKVRVPFPIGHMYGTEMTKLAHRNFPLSSNCPGEASSCHAHTSDVVRIRWSPASSTYARSLLDLSYQHLGDRLDELWRSRPNSAIDGQSMAIGRVILYRGQAEGSRLRTNASRTIDATPTSSYVCGHSLGTMEISDECKNYRKVHVRIMITSE